MRRTLRLKHALILAVLVATPIALKAQVPFCAATFDFQTNTLQGFTLSPLTGANLWHVANNVCQGQLAGHTTPFTLYYGQDQTCNYDTGAQNGGVATSPLVNLAGFAGPITVNFNYLLDIETAESFDQFIVRFSANGGTFGELVSKLLLGMDNAWHAASFDVTSTLGPNPSTAQVRFVFDTVDGLANGGNGVHIDDLTICGVIAVPVAPRVVLMMLAIFVAAVAAMMLRRRAPVV